MNDGVGSVNWGAAKSDSVVSVSRDGYPNLQQSGSLSWLSNVSRGRELLTYGALKRIIDVGGAILLTLVFFPVILMVFCSIVPSGGDVFFKHTRIGRNGRAFKVYKFRTMVPNAGQVLKEVLDSDPQMRAEWERDHKLRQDPRVTRIGKFLRKTSLDELPQIINVLRGEMSLVGPRPVVREELRKYRRSARHYLAVKPGLTGLWQVSGRNDTNYRRRVAMDRLYARLASPSIDLMVLVKTVDVVLRGRGAY